VDIKSLSPVQLQQVKERLSKLGLTDIMKPEEVQPYMIPPDETPLEAPAPVERDNKPEVSSHRGKGNVDSIINKWANGANDAYDLADRIPEPNRMLRDTTVNFKTLPSSKKRDALETIDEQLNGGEMLRRILNPNEDDFEE